MTQNTVVLAKASAQLAYRHVTNEREELLRLSALAKSNAQRLENLVQVLKNDPDQLPTAIAYLEHLVIENGLSHQEAYAYRQKSYRGYRAAKQLLA